MGLISMLESLYAGRAARLPSNTMSTEATDETNEVTTGEATRRYAELNIGDDEFVIYDRQNHQAWIQSTLALELADQQ